MGKEVARERTGEKRRAEAAAKDYRSRESSKGSTPTLQPGLSSLGFKETL